MTGFASICATARRLAVLSAGLLLAGCNIVGNPLVGGGTHLADTISFNTNPNRPVADAPNINRVLGQGYEEEPLLPEAGNVWPGPLPPSRTLSELQREGPLGSDPVAEPARAARPAATSAPVRGRVLQTPMGPGVTTIAGDGSETVLLPNGQKGSVTPAGSGTSTIRLPDGKTMTVPDPR